MAALKTVKSTQAYTVLETVTPKFAAELLKKNLNNRNLNQKSVKYYADQMKKGRWMQNGDTIKISKSGILLDGQHRLEGVIKSETSVKMLVAYDVDDESFMTIDAGRPRRYTDYLKVSGTSGDLNAISASARIAMGFDKSGEYNHVGKVSPDALLSWIDKHPGLEQAVGSIGGKLNNVCSRSHASALKYIFSHVDDVAAECFFDSLISGANLSEGSPILTLRKKLSIVRGGGGSGWTNEVIHYFVTAFNYYKANKKLLVLRYLDGSDTILDGFKGQLSDSSFYVK